MNKLHAFISHFCSLEESYDSFLHHLFIDKCNTKKSHCLTFLCFIIHKLSMLNIEHGNLVPNNRASYLLNHSWKVLGPLFCPILFHRRYREKFEMSKKCS